MWMKEGYKPLDGEERMRVERLLSEMGMERKLNIYCNRDARTNAVTFGFHTIGLTGGILQTASDEELKGVISHEVGHISHYDFVYQVLLFSMQSLGYRCLYGLFLIPALASCLKQASIRLPSEAVRSHFVTTPRTVQGNTLANPGG